MSLRVTLLGTGTSAGVPTLGCRCAVCMSADPRNKRRRCCAYLEWEGFRGLIDCGPDFRSQAIDFGIPDIDAVLLTHTHADHVNGIDDLRAYNMVHKHRIALYGAPDALDDIRTRFAYAFAPPQPGGGVPEFDLLPVDGPFEVAGRTIVPVPVLHGILPILGFRIGTFAYLTDVSTMPEESFPLVAGVEVLVLSALRPRPHPTHQSVDEAVAVARRIGARQTWFIHMNHDLDHESTNRALPPETQLAHDGLVIEL